MSRDKHVPRREGQEKRWNEEKRDREGEDRIVGGEVEEGHGSREDSSGEREREEWTGEQGWCDEKRGGKRRQQRMRGEKKNREGRKDKRREHRSAR